MNILVVNAGSTSVKFGAYTWPNEQPIISGQIELTDENTVVNLHKEGKKYSWNLPVQSFNNCSEIILKELQLIEFEVERIGHRVVHGGTKFTDASPITVDLLNELNTLSELAPLHNPPSLQRIVEFSRKLGDVPAFAVFDTAFHTTMPAKAYMYAIPHEFYEEYGVRRFGFHGISHQYTSEEMAKICSPSRLVTIHLGGGASMCAVQDGKSIDTSMGFTPLEGLMMATRPGDIDDGAIHYLMDKLHMSVKDMQKIENQHSGLIGVSGTTADMRKLLQKQHSDKRAKLAVEMYIYRVRKYLGMYAAVLGGLDAVSITGGVGAGSSQIRSRIFEGLEFLNIRIDAHANNAENVSQQLKISTNDSVQVWVIPTHEELQIARSVAEL